MFGWDFLEVQLLKKQLSLTRQQIESMKLLLGAVMCDLVCGGSGPWFLLLLERIPVHPKNSNSRAAKDFIHRTQEFWSALALPLIFSFPLPDPTRVECCMKGFWADVELRVFPRVDWMCA